MPSIPFSVISFRMLDSIVLPAAFEEEFESGERDRLRVQLQGHVSSHGSHAEPEESEVLILGIIPGVIGPRCLEFAALQQLHYEMSIMRISYRAQSNGALLRSTSCTRSKQAAEVKKRS